MDDVDAADLILSEGGIIMVDEAGFKTYLEIKPQDKVEVVAYPNPFQDRVNFQWGSEAPKQVILYSQQGDRVVQLSEAEIQNESLTNASSLISGIYVLKAIWKDGRETIKKLLKR